MRLVHRALTFIGNTVGALYDLARGAWRGVRSVVVRVRDKLAPKASRPAAVADGMRGDLLPAPNDSAEVTPAAPPAPAVPPRAAAPASPSPSRSAALRVRPFRPAERPFAQAERSTPRQTGYASWSSPRVPGFLALGDADLF
jgi:hypothetical protein